MYQERVSDKLSETARNGSIRDQLDSVRERIEQAAARAGRSSDEIVLIGVTKTHPVSTVMTALEAGLSQFGENRVQEAEEKIPQLEQHDITWHMLGHLQRNKANNAIQLFQWLHSLDSQRLARRLQQQLEKEGMDAYPVYIQVNTSGEDSKYGISPDQLNPLLERIARQCPRLCVKGLMTIAPFVDDEMVVRQSFRKLRELREKTDVSVYDNVSLTDLSMGMTNDFEIAIEEGATHLRIGRAIFGERRSR